MNKEQIEKDNYLDILFKTFKEAIDFFEAHNLRWFTAFGTCLGTIRHRGIIPWDDDIDLLMPRKDYKELERLFNKESKKCYFVSLKDRNYPFAYGKICDKNSTIIESKKSPMAFGVYIDIFPYDEYDLDEEKVIDLKLKAEQANIFYERSQNRITFKLLLDNLTKWKWHTLISNLRDLLWYRLRAGYYRRQMNSIESLSVDHGIYVALLTGRSRKRYVYKSTWFDSYLKLPYEDMTVRVPVGYDEYLKAIYGDYMKLPPEKERKTKHHRFYENYHKGLSFKEALKDASISL